MKTFLAILGSIGAVIGVIVAACAAIALAGYLIVLGASGVYVSGGAAEQCLKFKDTPSGRGELADFPGLRDVGPIHVEKVNALHALRNVVFIFCSAILLCILPIILILLTLWAFVLGIFTANWEGIWTGALGAVGSVVAVVIVPLAVIVLWIALLCQPFTPGYAILWLALGAPLALLGSAPNTYLIIVVVFRS